MARGLSAFLFSHYAKSRFSHDTARNCIRSFYGIEDKFARNVLSYEDTTFLYKLFEISYGASMGSRMNLLEMSGHMKTILII